MLIRFCWFLRGGWKRRRGCFTISVFLGDILELEAPMNIFNMKVYAFPFTLF